MSAEAGGFEEHDPRILAIGFAVAIAVVAGVAFSFTSPVERERPWQVERAEHGGGADQDPRVGSRW